MGHYFSSPSVPQTSESEVKNEKMNAILNSIPQQESKPILEVVKEPPQENNQCTYVDNKESVKKEDSEDVNIPDVKNEQVSDKKKRSKEEKETDAAPQTKKRKTSSVKSEKIEKPKQAPASSASKEDSNSIILSEYQKASATWGGPWINGFKWGVTNPNATLQRLLECKATDPRLKQISLFAQADRKSVFGFWMHSEKTQDDAPVIFLGPEGEAWVVASSLSQFIALQAAGLDGEMLKAWDGKDEEFESPEKYCEAYQTFLKWVKSKKIKPSAKSKVFKTIKSERSQHPPLKKFLFPEGKDDGYENDDE